MWHGIVKFETQLSIMSWKYKITACAPSSIEIIFTNNETNVNAVWPETKENTCKK